MKVKRILHKAFYLFGALFLSLLFIFQTAITPVKADENAVVYTDVLEDLQKDETFDIEQYPAVADDYSLQVIQIAESVNNELFVYVYQPSAGVKDLTATTIRMALPTVGINSTWQDYDLMLLSKAGVFQKYKVEGITVKEDFVRYYDITAIHRKYDKAIDSSYSGDSSQIVNEVPFEVAQKWTFSNLNDDFTCSMVESEVILIENKVVGYVSYLDGYGLLVDRCDSHFVAFNTDKPMERLIEADVEFVSQSYVSTMSLGTINTQNGEKVNNAVSLSEIDTASNKGDGLFGKEYSWKRIEKTSSFLSSENLEDVQFSTGTLENFKDTEWILRFYETKKTIASVGYHIEGTRVSKVTILRLYFETDGLFYNLGVVDNKSTGTSDNLGFADTNLDDILEEFDTWLEIIGIAIACIAVGVVLVFFVSIVWPVLWPLIVAVGKGLVKWIAKGIAFVFKLLWLIITLPFVLIGKLFGRKDKPDFRK